MVNTFWSRRLAGYSDHGNRGRVFPRKTVCSTSATLLGDEFLVHWKSTRSSPDPPADDLIPAAVTQMG